MLFGCTPSFDNLPIVDNDFLIGKLIVFPLLRPHFLEQLVVFCKGLMNNRDFKDNFVHKAVSECPVLIQRMYQCGFFDFQEINELIHQSGKIIYCYYFYNHLKDQIGMFHRENNIEYSYFEQECLYDELIQYGYPRISSEFSMKYDDLSSLIQLETYNTIEYAKWSPFEWSERPNSLDVLSFCGIFGSIKCFKYFLENGYSINKSITENVICGGSFDLVHLCLPFIPINDGFVIKATKFYRKLLIDYFMEEGYDILSFDLSTNPYSILSEAAFYGHLGLVEFFIGKGIDIESFGKYLFVTVLVRHLYAEQYKMDLFKSSGFFCKWEQILIPHLSTVQWRMEMPI